MSIRALLLAAVGGAACTDSSNDLGGNTESGSTDTEAATDGTSQGSASTAATDSASTTAATDSASTTAGTASSATTASSTTDGPTTTDGSTGTGDATDSGGDEAGYCAQGCEEPADCCSLGAIGCPGENYPNNWSCTDGICEFGGCENNDDCSVPPGQECHAIGGIGTCFEPCANNDDCLVGECTGMADDDTMYCQSEVPPCEDDGDCNGAGVCDVDEGTCYCDSDANCTDDTLDTCAL